MESLEERDAMSSCPSSLLFLLLLLLIFFFFFLVLCLRPKLLLQAVFSSPELRSDDEDRMEIARATELFNVDEEQRADAVVFLHGENNWLWLMDEDDIGVELVVVTVEVESEVGNPKPSPFPWGTASELRLRLVTIGPVAFNLAEKSASGLFSDIGDEIGGCLSGEETANVSQFLPMADVYMVFKSFLPFILNLQNTFFIK